MLNVPIKLTANDLSIDTIETLHVSVPVSQGTLFNTGGLKLLNQKNECYPCQFNRLAFWPDNSIKWLSIHFHYISPSNSNTEQLYLTCSQNIDALDNSSSSGKPVFSPSITSAFNASQKIEYSQQNETLLVNTGDASFHLSTNILGCFSAQSDANETSSQSSTTTYKSNDKSLLLIDTDNIEYLPIINHISLPKNTTELITSCISFSGEYKNQQNDTLLNFTADLHFFSGCAKTQWRITLHNPKCMEHKDGKWDLGNTNSVFFKSLNAHIPTGEIHNIDYKIESDLSWQKTSSTSFELLQTSSGGKNWRSRNHVDHLNNVNIPFNGYSLKIDDNVQIINGRATPQLICNTAANKINVTVDKFWQNFPKKLTVQNDELVIGLFPAQESICYELQPGEKKSHTFSIDYSEKQAVPNQAKTQVHVDPKYIADTNAVPFFSNDKNDIELTDIINQGLTGENNFFNKRETIDEFGWRNFGDLYADHEAIEYKGDAQLISHYNNQYDPLYGFLRQYLITGKYKWLELANDLAAHVKDIDIYHTTKDKAEYNGGLFWHTDHYLPAETASHRTYSKRQTANAYQDHAGGGGPGGQHCYTTGLMLHYFLTGDNSSKDAAMTINHWITSVYEGTNTIADLLIAIKNKNRIDLKNVFTGKYPFDRGTGHYIIALIDTFELTGKQYYLDQASLVIKNTVHPDDDISQRDLDNVEATWFYTIFFQATYRFLQTKEHNNQLDRSFDYARNCLLHYSNWMLDNEAPYLSKPDILEYPNHTWTAQDIRKANVLFFAAYYSGSHDVRDAFINKANSLYQYVTEELANEPTSDTTRILSILMQNHGIRSYCLNNKSTKADNNALSFSYFKNEKNAKQNILDALYLTLKRTSITQEMDWLRKRVSKIDNLLNKLGK